MLQKRMVCSLIMLWAGCALTAHSGIYASRPVGVLRLTVEPGETLMFATPFHPFVDHVNGALGVQLSPGDRILEWDTAHSRYRIAERCRESDLDESGIYWSETGSNACPSRLSIQPGTGYWVQNRQIFTQTLYLYGAVIGDACIDRKIFPRLNAAGYPYACDVNVSDTSLEEYVSVPGGMLHMGQGFWIDVTGRHEKIWRETRPYEFSAAFDDAKTRITGMQVIHEGRSLKLQLVSEPENNAAWHLWTLDVQPGGGFDERGDWRRAAVDVLSGSRYVEWVDSDAVTNIYARYYMLSTADRVEQLQNTLSRKTNRSNNELMSSADHLDPEPGFSLSVSSNQYESMMMSIPGVSNGQTQSQNGSSRMIYVDQKHGNDQFDGRSPVALSAKPDSASCRRAGKAVARGRSGPKRTIRRGLEIAEPGDLLVIHAGQYTENMHLASCDVKVRIQGKVRITSRIRADDTSQVYAQSIETNSVFIKEVLDGISQHLNTNEQWSMP